MFSKVFILLAGFCTISGILCLQKKICVLTDVACTTETARHILKLIGLGNPTYNIESLDPIHLDIIEAILPNLNYTLRNVTLGGSKDCETVQLKINPDLSFYYYMVCPRLTIEGDYEVSGYFADEHVEGKGKCKIVHDDYHIGTTGQHESFVGDDGKEHWRISKYELDLLDVRGSVIYGFQNLFYGDEEKSKKIHNYINTNWKKVSAVTEYPAMYAFMGIVYESVSKYHAYVPKDDVFYTYV